MIEIINQKGDRILIKTESWRKWRVRRTELEKYFDDLFGDE